MKPNPGSKSFLSRITPDFSFNFVSHFFPLVLLCMLLTLITMNAILLFKSPEKFSNISDVPDHLKLTVANAIEYRNHPELTAPVIGHTVYHSHIDKMESDTNCDDLPKECFVRPLSLKTLKKVNARHNYLTKKNCKCKNKLEHDRNMNFAYVGHELEGIKNAIETTRKFLT